VLRQFAEKNCPKAFTVPPSNISWVWMPYNVGIVGALVLYNWAIAAPQLDSDLGQALGVLAILGSLCRTTYWSFEFRNSLAEALWYARLDSFPVVRYLVGIPTLAAAIPSWGGAVAGALVDPHMPESLARIGAMGVAIPNNAPPMVLFMLRLLNPVLVSCLSADGHMKRMNVELLKALCEQNSSLFKLSVDERTVIKDRLLGDIEESGIVGRSRSILEAPSGAHSLRSLEMRAVAPAASEDSRQVKSLSALPGRFAEAVQVKEAKTEEAKTEEAGNGSIEDTRGNLAAYSNLRSVLDKIEKDGKANSALLCFAREALSDKGSMSETAVHS
jgi:hypothetical protein